MPHRIQHNSASCPQCQMLSGIKDQLVPLTPTHPIPVIYPVPWHSFLLYAGVGYLHGNVSATAEGGACSCLPDAFQLLSGHGRQNDAKGLSIMSFVQYVWAFSHMKVHEDSYNHDPSCNHVSC